MSQLTAARPLIISCSLPYRSSPRKFALGACARVRLASSAAASAKVRQPKAHSPPGSGKDEADAAIDKEKTSMELMKRYGLPSNYIDLMEIPLSTVDVPVKWSAVPISGGILAQWRWVRDRLLNFFGNAMALVNLARWRCLPSIPYEKQPSRFVQKYLSLKPWQSRSTSNQSWLAPFLKDAMQTYIEINEAVASGSSRTITALCRGEYAAQLVGRISSRPKGARLHWQLHKVVSPPVCVSIRAAEMMDLKGSELYTAQAIVKFNTMQSIVVQQVHNRAGASKPVAAEPKHIVEYLLFDGRLKDPFDKFKVRAQMFEDPVRFTRKPEKKSKS